jgi:hypothetical protein
MATGSSTKKPCCRCNKGGATFTCDGCCLSFCLKHASDHRQELSKQMDNIGQQHDILKRDIDQQPVDNTLLVQIDRWEKESIAMIRSTADKARSDLKRLTEESTDRLTSLMGKLSDELRLYRESDDYIEDDLDRWVKQLKELQNELEKPSEIEIEEKKLVPLYLLGITKRNIHGDDIIGLSSQKVTRSVEKFSEAVGPLVLSKNSRCVTNRSESYRSDNFSSTCGILLYSSDIHRVRFRIYTSPGSAVFLGIIKSSETISNESAKLKSAYGCWSRGSLVNKGSFAEAYEKIQTLSNDEVTITLDCFSRKFSYLHERTNKCITVEVDERFCPLPWKLVVTLWYPGDNIQILDS